MSTKFMTTSAQEFAENAFWNKYKEWSSSTSTQSWRRRKVLLCWFHHLPDSVLLKIFSNFGEKELRKSIIPTCQKWRSVASHPSLWKKLIFRGQHIPTNFICQQIRTFTQLQKITLINVAEPSAIIRQICRSLPDLKHLIVRFANNIHETTLRNVIKSCENLQTLDLKKTAFRGNLFYEELSTLKYLKYQTFGGNPYMSVQNLMMVLLNCHNLEEIYLCNFSSCMFKNQLSDTDMSFMIANISSSLRCLELDTSTLTDVSFQAILKCNKLECLGLFGASNLSSYLFRNLWVYLPNLKHIKIRYANQITDEDVTELFTAGKEVLKKVETVDLTGCWKIKNQCVEAIAECCRNLRILVLKGCKSIDNLSVLQEKCPHLELLNIAFCNIKADCISPLLRNLKVLIINENNFFNNIIHSLQVDGLKVGVHACISEYSDDIKRIQYSSTSN